ncbi:MAG: hypothetical protein ACYS0H_21225 [Planctomycetota bacterium]|jgi:hypothetical protein
MERDAIERLAIDSASGELNDDAETLLREYLAGHAEANRWAEEVQWLCEKTEAAIRAKTKNAGAGIERAAVGKEPALRVKWRPAARWAAAVVFAAIIGFTVGRREKSDTRYEPALPQSASAPRQVKTVSDLREQYAGTFWGDKMLAVLEHRPGQRRKANQHDERFWDRYGQYRKEKRHE